MSISTLRSARRALNSFGTEVRHFNDYMKKSLNPDNLNLDFTVINRKSRDLNDLKADCKKWQSSMQSIINNGRKKDSDNYADAKEIKQQMVEFEKVFYKLEKSYLDVSKDFQNFDKKFESRTHRINTPNIGVSSFFVEYIGKTGGNKNPSMDPLFKPISAALGKSTSGTDEKTSTTSQEALNNENKIDAMTPKTDEEKNAILAAKTAEVFNSLVDVNSDGSWKKIDWDKVVELFEKPGIQEHEYYALLALYSQMQETEGSSLEDNLENFLSCGTIVDSSDRYAGHSTTLSFTKFSPSPILIQIGNDLYNTVQASVPYVGDLNADDKKKFELLSAKSSILVNNNMYGSYTITGKHLYGDMIKGETEKVGHPNYGTTKWLSPNSYKRVMGENFPNSARITIDIENPGDYTLILPKHISASNWKNDKTNLNLDDLGKAIYGPDVLVNEIRGYPSVHGLGSHAVFSNSFYTDQIAFLRPEIKEDLGFWENMVDAVTGEVKGNVSQTIASLIKLERAAKIAAPFVMIPYDLLKEHAQNQENIATNEQIDRALNGAQYATNLAMIGGEYKVSTCNGEYMLEWQYLSPEKLESMTAKLNKELSKNGLPVTTSAYVENLMLERATFIGAPYGGDLSEYDIKAYEAINTINDRGVSDDN